jgi:hypothetical protein
MARELFSVAVLLIAVRRDAGSSSTGRVNLSQGGQR